jgi:hypothetical protein
MTAREIAGGKITTVSGRWCPCIKRKASAMCECFETQTTRCETIWKREQCTCTLKHNQQIIATTRKHLSDNNCQAALYAISGKRPIPLSSSPPIVNMVTIAGPWEYEPAQSSSDIIKTVHAALSNPCSGKCTDSIQRSIPKSFYQPIAMLALSSELGNKKESRFEDIAHVWCMIEKSKTYQEFVACTIDHFMCACIRALFFKRASGYYGLKQELSMREHWKRNMQSAYADIDKMVEAIVMENWHTIPSYTPIKFSIRSSNRLHMIPSSKESYEAQLKVIDMAHGTAASCLFGYCSSCKVPKYKEASIGFPKCSLDHTTGQLTCTAPKCGGDIHYIDSIGSYIRYRNTIYGPCEQCGRRLVYKYNTPDVTGYMKCNLCRHNAKKTATSTSVCDICKKTMKNGRTIVSMDNDNLPSISLQHILICQKCEDSKDISTTRSMRKKGFARDLIASSR